MLQNRIFSGIAIVLLPIQLPLKAILLDIAAVNPQICINFSVLQYRMLKKNSY